MPMATRGDGAFPGSILQNLRDDAWVRGAGYGKYPGDSRSYEQYVLCVDGEASLRMGRDEGRALLECAATGPVSCEILLPPHGTTTNTHSAPSPVCVLVPFHARNSTPERLKTYKN